MSQSFLTPSGNPRNLRVYKVTEVIYDLTYYFTQHYLQRGDRTIDQMVQAARSGKQNIIEGNEAGTTSRETNIKLTNVARASLAELLIDYEDYLRVRNLPLWGATHPRYERIRSYARSEELQQEYQSLMPRLTAEELCNLTITLIHQADYLLGRLLQSQQELFLNEGGIRERMSAMRREARRRGNQSDRSDQRDRSDRRDRSDQRDRSYQRDRSDRSDRSDQRDQSDRSDQSDQSHRSRG